MQTISIGPKNNYSYSVGVAPFCAASEKDCIPYFDFEKDEESKGCWTGSKGKCKFNVDKWKKGPIFRELQKLVGRRKAIKYIPEKFYVYGKAPFCDETTPCSAIGRMQWPIGATQSGGGGTCTSGTKYVAIDAVPPEHSQIVRKLYSECLVKNISEDRVREEKLKAIGKLIDFMGDVIPTSSASRGIGRIVRGIRG